MNRISPHLIISILNKDYPDVADSISSKILSVLPDYKITNHDMIKVVYDQFCKLKNIDQSAINWNNSRGCNITSIDVAGDDKIYSVIQLREIFIGVILMFYQPEKLFHLSSTNKTKSGLVKNICDLLECNRVSISKNVSNTIVHFKSYQDYKNEVVIYYNIIKINLENIC